MCVSCTRIIRRSWTLSPSSAVSCCHRSFWFWDYEQNIWNLFIAENVFSDFFSSVFHSFFLSCLLFNWQVLLNGDFSITVYPTNPTDLSSRECLLLSMSPITCEITSIQGCLMSSRHTFLAFHRCPRFQLYLDTLPRILTLKKNNPNDTFHCDDRSNLIHGFLFCTLPISYILLIPAETLQRPIRS